MEYRTASSLDVPAVSRRTWIVLSRAQGDRRQLVVDLESWLRGLGLVSTVWLQLYMQGGREAFIGRIHSQQYQKDLMRCVLDNVPAGFVYLMDEGIRYLVPDGEVDAVIDRQAAVRRAAVEVSRNNQFVEGQS